MPASPGKFKQRVEPYAQGDLDDMCAIYAIINACRAVCPEITEDVSTRLFRYLVRSLPKHTKQILFPIILGTDDTLFRDLLGEAQRYVGKQLKIELLVERVGPILKTKSLETAWKRLAACLNGQTVVLMALGGCCNHWTVLYDSTPKRIRLLDSGHRRKLKRAMCTLEAHEKHYRLRLSSAVTVSRPT